MQIDLLKPGVAVGSTSDGKPITLVITDEIMRQVVETFDPNRFKPPLIISHNSQGIPDADLAESELAHGTPSKLEIVGDKVKGFFDNASSQIKQWFESGQLLSISPSLYPPEHPANPTPGKWCLRHVAALGKSPPAIKDLQVSFEEALCFSSDVAGVIDLPYSQFLPTEEIVTPSPVSFGEGVVPIDTLAKESIEYAPMSALSRLQSQVDELYSSYADFTKAKENMNMSESQTPDTPELQALRDRIAQLESENAAQAANFAEQSAQIAAHSAKLAEMLSMAEEQKKRLDERERQLEHQEVVSFVEGLVAEKKILASDKARKVAILLAADNTQALNFGEGEDKTHRQMLMADMAAADVLPIFKEIKTSGNPTPEFKGYLNFSIPEGATLESSAQQEMQRVTAYMAEHKIPATPANFSAVLTKFRSGGIA